MKLSQPYIITVNGLADMAAHTQAQAFGRLRGRHAHAIMCGKDGVDAKVVYVNENGTSHVVFDGNTKELQPGKEGD